MRITELFTAQSIALDVAAPDQAAILDKLVDLQATHGNITDKDAYKKALYAREAEASTYVDNGITVPHARTACVTRPSLAALRLSTPVQYNADDDGKTDLLFAIAAPENGSLHIDMLARMMQMLMNDDFVEKLRAAKTPTEFLDAIDAQEDAQFGEESFTQQEIPRNGYRVLAVTACPHGAIALVDGIARVDRSKCTGCGLCGMACPQRVIAFVPGYQNILVRCNNTDKGAIARKVCDTSCIGCGMCVKKCPAGAIRIEDNCAHIDGVDCLSCGMCAVVCPHGAIHDRTGIAAGV